MERVAQRWDNGGIQAREAAKRGVACSEATSFEKLVPQQVVITASTKIERVSGHINFAPYIPPPQPLDSMQPSEPKPGKKMLDLKDAGMTSSSYGYWHGW